MLATSAAYGQEPSIVAPSVPPGSPPEQQADKTELHATINRIVAKTFDVDGSFPNRAGDWVFVHEVPNGSWGASGQTIGIREINHVAGGGSERSKYFEQLLAAQERVREAYGFPSEISRTPSEK